MLVRLLKRSIWMLILDCHGFGSWLVLLKNSFDVLCSMIIDDIANDCVKDSYEIS